MNKKNKEKIFILETYLEVLKKVSFLRNNINKKVEKNLIKEKIPYIMTLIILTFLSLLGVIYYTVNASLFGLTLYFYLFLIPTYYTLLKYHERFYHHQPWSLSPLVKKLLNLITFFMLIFFSILLILKNYLIIQWLIYSIDIIMLNILITHIEGFRFLLFYSKEIDYFLCDLGFYGLRRKEREKRKKFLERTHTDSILKKAHIKKLRESVIFMFDYIYGIEEDIMRGKYDKEIFNFYVDELYLLEDELKDLIRDGKLKEASQLAGLKNY